VADAHPTRTLAEALQRTRPFRSPEQEGVLLLLRVSDALRRALSRVVEPRGITLQQYNVLRILRGAGPDGLPTLAIGDRMIERAPGVTRLLDRLEGEGWVLRTRGSEDRRQVLARITPAGARLLDTLDPAVAQAEDALMAALEPEALGVLSGHLETLRRGLDAG
jgi:MarR family transcriptional regulator, organic hydroperoxide resistance regulator